MESCHAHYQVRTACLLVEEDRARLLIDPGEYSRGFEELTDLDAILITHQHGDHMVPETLAALLAHNPQAEIYADEGSVELLADKGIAAQAVHEGDKLAVAGVDVRVIGRDHAVIHPEVPVIPNVGYLVAGRFFHPGDAFTNPGQSVDILATPLGAPWLKAAEMVDYVRGVKPKVAIPVHDAVLAIPEMHINLLKRLTEERGIEVRVVPNGHSTEA